MTEWSANNYEGRKCMEGTVGRTWSGWRKEHKSSVRGVDLRVETWKWDLPYTKRANHIRKPLFRSLGNSTS